MRMKHISGLLLIVLATTSCASHRFIPTGMANSTALSKPKDCGAKVLLRQPVNIKYSELGICMAQTLGGGMISDNTPEAIIELQKCACLHGGDAVILGGTIEAGVIPGFGGYSQQVAKSQGVVIMFEK